jgi:hypothetical protein
MGEFVPFAGMVFSLLVVLIIGGFILVYPLTKRLGRLLELRLEERQSGGERSLAEGEVERLREAVEALQVEVAALADRQQFTERLLESGRGPARPDGGEGGGVETLGG